MVKQLHLKANGKRSLMGNDIGIKNRTKRSEDLIAKFSDGYAENWFMAIGEQFKNELDIKKTKRKKNSEFIGVWTQGTSYSFAEGQVFYDTPKGYSIWSEALGKIIFTCKILKAEAKTNTAKHKGAHEGFVEFALYKINSEKTNIVEIGIHKMTQDDFVIFLHTGKIDGTKIDLIYG